MATLVAAPPSTAPLMAANLRPIIPHYICRDCDRRHSTRTVIGREHLHLARPPKHPVSA